MLRIGPALDYVQGEYHPEEVLGNETCFWHVQGLYHLLLNLLDRDGPQHSILKHLLYHLLEVHINREHIRRNQLRTFDSHQIILLGRSLAIVRKVKALHLLYILL